MAITILYPLDWYVQYTVRFIHGKKTADYGIDIRDACIDGHS